MIKRTLLITLLVFVTINIQAQDFVKGTVFDAISKQPIPYVNIGILENANGTVSEEDGGFELKIKASDATIRFSSIGYESKTLVIYDLKPNENIFLKPISYQIDMLKVKAKEFRRKKKLGKKVRTKINTISWGSSDFLGLEIGVPIKINKESLIKSAHFGVLKSSTPNTLLRVNIYEFKNGKVGKNLMPENVFVTSGNLMKYKKVELSHLNLVVEDDILLSLETIEKENGEGFYLQFGAGLTFKGNIYCRDASQAEFRKAKEESMVKLGAYLKVKQVR